MRYMSSSVNFLLMARTWEGKSPDLWVKTVQGLPPEPLKFALNASLDTLPTNANLYTWAKKDSDTCAAVILGNVLNHCQKEMELRRYSRRHYEALKVIGDFIQAYILPDFSFTIDHPSESYSFPHHITPIGLRPDIVRWSDKQRQLWQFELTISFEPPVAYAHEGKQAKYLDLLEAGKGADRDRANYR